MTDTELLNSINEISLNHHRQLYQGLSGHRYNQIFDIADIRSALIQSQIEKTKKYHLSTDHPIAINSSDHTHPWGTKNDDTRCPRFVAALEKFFKRPLCAMDLGCSGGGIVYDFIHRGHSAVGLEGSDYSFKSQRAEWRVIPNNLYTCDITKPFRVTENNAKDYSKFDVICIWEVLEHIKEIDLPQLLLNVKNHLTEDGILIGSIALGDDIVNGISYHPTVHEKSWWINKFQQNGFEMLETSVLEFGDHCRGVGNGPMDDDYMTNPHVGFHFSARLIL